MISLQRQDCGESLDWRQESQVNQMGHDGGVDQGDRSEGNEKWSGLGYHRKVMHDFLMDWKWSMREEGHRIISKSCPGK